MTADKKTQSAYDWWSKLSLKKKQKLQQKYRVLTIKEIWYKES